MLHYQFYIDINSKLCALLQKHKIERLEYGVGGAIRIFLSSEWVK